MIARQSQAYEEVEVAEMEPSKEICSICLSLCSSFCASRFSISIHSHKRRRGGEEKEKRGGGSLYSTLSAKKRNDLKDG